MDARLYNSILTTFKERLIESEKFHMGVGKVNETLSKLAADLESAEIAYAIIGALALNAHGYRRETVDVDVLVRPEGLVVFRDQLVGKGYRPAFEGARKTFRNTHTNTTVEFLTSGDFPGDGKPKPIAFPDPAAVSCEIGGVKVITLPALIDLKLASGMSLPSRRRDLADVQDLIRILSLDQSFAASLHPYVRDTYLQLLDELRSPDPHQE